MSIAQLGRSPEEARVEVGVLGERERQKTGAQQHNSSDRYGEKAQRGKFVTHGAPVENSPSLLPLFQTVLLPLPDAKIMSACFRSVSIGW